MAGSPCSGHPSPVASRSQPRAHRGPAGATLWRLSRGGWQRGLLWLLIQALALYGYTGVLVQALGPLHQHSPAAPVAAIEPCLMEHTGAQPSGSETQTSSATLLGRIAAALLDWHQRALAAQQLLAPPAQEPPLRHALNPAHQEHLEHHHGLFERHHHELSDGTLVALDSSAASTNGDELNTAAVAVMAALPRMMPSALTVAPPAARATRWPAVQQRAWQSAELAQPERPPQA